MEEKKSTETHMSINEPAQDSVSATIQSSHHSTIGNNPAEAILAIIAYIFLTLGIIFSIIVGGLFILDDHDWDTILGWAILFGGTILSLIIWANYMIIINISNNIRQIKYELQGYIEK